MLTIRSMQIQAIAAARRGEFHDRIADYLRADHPATVAGLSYQALRDRIALGEVRASLRGFTRESSIATFVMLMFTVAPDFDDHRDVRRILEYEKAPVDRRLLLLAHAITEPQWDEIRRWSRHGWQDFLRKEPAHVGPRQ